MTDAQIAACRWPLKDIGLRIETLDKMDFQKTLRYMRALKRAMDAPKTPALSVDKTDPLATQNCPAVDNRAVQAVMRQYGDGQQPTDSATEFAYFSRKMKCAKSHSPDRRTAST